MKRLAIIGGVLLAGLLTGCYAEMSPATNVGGTTATLNAKIKCVADLDGTYYWETRVELGMSPWVQRGMGVGFNCVPDQNPNAAGYQGHAGDTQPEASTCSDGSCVPVSRNVSGLMEHTGYQYRLRAVINGNTYTTEPLDFLTSCDGEGC